MLVQVTRINLGGYSLAFAGVCWYNYKKLQVCRSLLKPLSFAVLVHLHGLISVLNGPEIGSQTALATQRLFAPDCAGNSTANF